MRPNYKKWLAGQIEGELGEPVYDLERLSQRTLELLWQEIMGRQEPLKLFKQVKGLD
jgi:hypothetical protein